MAANTNFGPNVQRVSYTCWYYSVYVTVTVAFFLITADGLSNAYDCTDVRSRGAGGG